MNEWSNASDEERPPTTRISVKIHRNVALVRTADALLADELTARSKLAGCIVGRLTDSILLVQPGAVQDLVAELRRLGHAPHVLGVK